MPSFTYHLLLAVLKLKGLKKDFSQDPVDFEKIRKEDIHTPKGRFFTQQNVTHFSVLNSKITAIDSSEKSNPLLIYVHGGAFISGPSPIHWDTVKTLSQRTKAAVWLCDYPKAPENTIDIMAQNIDAIYETALESYSANQIILIGDSVGGTLITALVQRLIAQSLSVPQKIVLISPVMDASLTNSQIAAVDKLDPMLSRKGILSSKKMCAGNYALKDPIISPLYGDFDGFPATMLLLAEHDIMYPDGKLAYQKLKAAKVAVTLIEGTKMPHIWPILPVMKEAKVALKQIVDYINT